MRSRRVALLVSLTAALLLGGAALAWACTSQAYVTIHPKAGQAGSQVTVDGSGFTKDVQIRWHTEDGALLGTAQSGSFQKQVTIPSGASDGHYYVVAVGYDEDGQRAGKSSASFEVTSSSSSSDDGGQPEGNGQTGTQETTAGDQQTDQQSSTDSNQSTDESNESQPSSGGQSSSESTGEFGQVSDGGGQATQDTSPDQQSTGQRSSDGDTTADSDRQPTAQADSDPQPSSSNQRSSDPAPQQPVNDGSAARDGQATSGQQSQQGSGSGDSESAASGEPATDDEAEPASDELQPAAMGDAASWLQGGRFQDGESRAGEVAASPHGDLWSGLDASAPSSAPSLDGSSVAQAGASNQQLLAVGAGALGVGLVLLLGTALAMATRRRTVLARRDV